jgi:hypothetical protein
MAKCPHCGKELEFTVIPRKPKAAASVAKAKTAKTTGKKTASKPVAKPTARTTVKKNAEPKKPPKRPLLKNPDFLSPGNGS